jgi:hypothetical protein
MGRPLSATDGQLPPQPSELAELAELPSLAGSPNPEAGGDVGLGILPLWRNGADDNARQVDQLDLISPIGSPVCSPSLRVSSMLAGDGSPELDGTPVYHRGCRRLQTWRQTLISPELESDWVAEQRSSGLTS